MPSSPSSFAIYNNMLSLSLSLSLSLLRALSLSGRIWPMKLTEETLRSDSRIERLMKNPNWKLLIWNGLPDYVLAEIFLLGTGEDGL
jgi:hypothetical protein